MNLGNDPADQMVRFTLAGTEVVLRLSGIAAKNFAMFAYAVLKDQKKTRGKTRLVRMLREGRSFKFYKIPVPLMKEFTQQARSHGLLYVPIRDKQDTKRIEVAVFADDAAKVQRICDRLHIDYVAAQSGSAEVEQGNFTQGREKTARQSGNSSPGRDASAPENGKPSVKRQLQDIRNEQSKNTPHRTRRPQRKPQDR